MKRKGVAACMAILLVCVGIAAANVQEQKGGDRKWAEHWKLKKRIRNETQ